MWNEVKYEETDIHITNKQTLCMKSFLCLSDGMVTDFLETAISLMSLRSHAILVDPLYI